MEALLAPEAVGSKNTGKRPRGNKDRAPPNNDGRAHNDAAIGPPKSRVQSTTERNQPSKASSSKAPKRRSFPVRRPVAGCATSRAVSKAQSRAESRAASHIPQSDDAPVDIIEHGRSLGMGEDNYEGKEDGIDEGNNEGSESEGLKSGALLIFMATRSTYAFGKLSSLSKQAPDPIQSTSSSRPFYDLWSRWAGSAAYVPGRLSYP